MSVVGKFTNLINASRFIMSEHMRRHRTKHDNDIIRIHHAGAVYQFPKKVAEKYRTTDHSVSADDLFAATNKKYTKPGALLRGIRIRDNLTQAELAKRIKVTQSDISQMENGTRSIGRMIAKRIEKLFSIDYKSFLE